MNLSTLIVIIILFVTVMIVIKSMIKNKKNGNSCCRGSCGSCATSSLCHDFQKLEKEYKKDSRK